MLSRKIIQHFFKQIEPFLSIGTFDSKFEIVLCSEDIRPKYNFILLLILYKQKRAAEKDPNLGLPKLLYC
jgi:hypothetical protein